MIFSCLKPSDGAVILLIIVKMSRIFGILTFMGRINFMLSKIEHEKSFITLGPGVSSMSPQVLTTPTIDATVTLLLFMLNYSVSFAYYSVLLAQLICGLI